MSEYENEFSQFPARKITKHNFKNIDDIVAPLINEITSLRLQGLTTQAAIIIQNNANLLAPYIIDATVFRTLEEEIYNTQKYAKQIQQSVFIDETEPVECQIGDIWIGGGAI